MNRRSFLASLLGVAAPLVLPETRRVYSFMPDSGALWEPGEGRAALAAFMMRPDDGWQRLRNYARVHAGRGLPLAYYEACGLRRINDEMSAKFERTREQYEETYRQISERISATMRRLSH